MKIHLEAMMKSVTSLMATLPGNIEASFKHMTPDQAIEFQNTMNSNNVSDKLEEIKQSVKGFKQDFNFK